MWKCLLETQLRERDVITPIETFLIGGFFDLSEFVEPAYAYDMGKAAIVLVMRPSADDLFFPAMFVVERCRAGEGELSSPKEYCPLKVSGLPNFDRAIRSALDLSIRLTDRPKKRDLPKGVMVAPDKDHFFLHIGMLRVTPEQLDTILNALTNESQPSSGFTPSENLALEGGFGGEGVEGVEEGSENGREEERLVSGAEAYAGDA